ncbi:hypothetical protein ACTM5Z_004371 [Salmonella enterica]
MFDSIWEVFNYIFYSVFFGIPGYVLAMIIMSVVIFTSRYYLIASVKKGCLCPIIHHVTPVENLDKILESRTIYSSSNGSVCATSDVDRVWIMRQNNVGILNFKESARMRFRKYAIKKWWIAFLLPYDLEKLRYDEYRTIEKGDLFIKKFTRNGNEVNIYDFSILKKNDSGIVRVKNKILILGSLFSLLWGVIPLSVVFYMPIFFGGFDAMHNIGVRVFLIDYIDFIFFLLVSFASFFIFRMRKARSLFAKK